MDDRFDIRIFASGGGGETVAQQLDRQVVVMATTPGSIEVGLKPNGLSRFHYGSGEMILCRKHIQEWVRWVTPMKMVVVSLPAKALQAATESAGGREPELQVRARLEDERARRLMIALDTERASGFPSGRLYIDSIGQALAAVLVQTHGVMQQPLKAYRSGLAPYQMRRVTEFIQEHLEKDIALHQIAEVAGLSMAYFSRLLRQSTGVSPHQFLLQARVDRARDLLRQPEMRVLDVAIACGFQTQQHFARVFRELCQVSPTEYRRQVLS